MKEYLLIPQKDIQCLDIAYKDLHAILANLKIHSALVSHITEAMWKLTNTKYRTAKDFAEPDEVNNEQNCKSDGTIIQIS